MKLTKEDYMRLPKERLAELLVEMQEAQPLTITAPAVEPNTIPWTNPIITCYSEGWLAGNN